MIKMLKKNPKIKLFTTPSHGQKFSIFSKLKSFYKYDISENDAYNPEEALEKSQKNAAKIYGTKSTNYLINGSTSGVIASVLSCVKKDEKVLIWDNAHRCHLNAVKLAGAIPVFYSLEKDENWGFFKETKISDIEIKLKENDIKAVIVTSPSYFGVQSNIKSLSEICKKYGAYLIVDEAHGALYPFFEELGKSAINEGADFIIQSLHKTAGGLNPTALLHNNTTLDVKPYLDMISTTSPSYPLLASIEKNIAYLNSKKGKDKVKKLICSIKNLKENVNNVEFYDGLDVTKIVVKKSNMTGEELSKILYDNYIEDEKVSEKSVLLLCGLGCDEKKLKYLEKVLKKL